MTARCGLDALLSAGGPVRVAVRPCCLAALVGRRPGAVGDRSGSEAAVGSPSGGRAIGGTSSTTSTTSTTYSGHVGFAPVAGGAGLICEAAAAELQVTS
jgi:hypothetical protein